MLKRHILPIISVLGVLLWVGVMPITAQEPAGNTTYTVQQGDNLYRIALNFGFTVDELARLNNIVDSGHIYAGQVLIIPAAIGGGAESVELPPIQSETAPIETPVEAPPIETAPVAEAPTPAQTHIVQANEGLMGIAKLYGMTWTALAAQNNITNPNLIYPGQVLNVSGATLTPPADYGQPPVSSEGKMILVELSLQRISAYQDGALVRQVTVSTGLPATPTVQGDYSVYSKLPEQTMYGPGYYLPGVPWVMYFYQGYAIHGTYWHSNFGQPMSHGCVNLTPEEALWFYEFAPIGTHVRVIP